MTSRLKRIFLYDDPSAKTLSLSELATYLRDLVGVEVDVRGEFLTHHLRGDENRLSWTAERLAATRVSDLNKPLSGLRRPIYGEVEFERRSIRSPERRALGVLYEGFLLQTLLAEILPYEEADLSHLHLVFTPRLTATFDEADRRYHARVVVCSYPSIISTTGIVEAPAKPREFYLAIQASMSPTDRTLLWERLKEEYRGRFIDFEDERLTEVLKGYAVQALIYQTYHEPFCSDAGCRLYNAHWQEEVLRAQLEPPEFCERHWEMLRRLREVEL